MSDGASTARMSRNPMRAPLRLELPTFRWMRKLNRPSA